MKKHLFIVTLLLTTLCACEKDEICIDAVTPNLLIRFYDFDNQSEFKSVTALKVISEGQSAIYENQTLDSIAIPLDITNNTILYEFSREDTIDEITLTYEHNDVFVSRSCGFKTIFDNLNTQTNSSNWIKKISIINDSVENEFKAHIYIYH